jgi:hypothetical protein
MLHTGLWAVDLMVLPSLLMVRRHGPNMLEVDDEVSARHGAQVDDDVLKDATAGPRSRYAPPA